MKYNKKELVEALTNCAFGTSCRRCPYVGRDDDCDNLIQMVEDHLPDTPDTEAFDHDWEVEPIGDAKDYAEWEHFCDRVKDNFDNDSEVEPVSDGAEDNDWEDFCDWFEDMFSNDFGKPFDKDEKSEISPTRKPFVERDLLFDKVIDAQAVLESWEGAWSCTQKQIEDDRKEIKDRQLKEIDELYSSEHNPCSRDFDIRCMELLKDHAMEWDAYHKDVDDAVKFYEDKKNEFVDNLFKAKDDLKQWDDTHDPCTGELKEEPAEVEAPQEEIPDRLFNFDKAMREYAEFIIEMTFGSRDEFEKNWAHMQEVLPFDEVLKEFGELDDSEIEAAKNIKTFDDAVNWLTCVNK